MAGKSARHRSIKPQARIIDEFIGRYMKSRKTSRLPDKRILEPVVKFIFKDYRPLGRGWFKHAYFIPSRNKKRRLVLKMCREGMVLKDYKISKRLSKRFFARIYWHTRFCMLQKYGERRKVPRDTLLDLQNEARKAGLDDVNPKNVRYFPDEGRFKIIDANVRKK